MKVEKIQASSAPERVVKQFLENLEKGTMRPGQKLPSQDKLSELFGLSRPSIREAMNALAMLGYLEITQGRGSFIKKELPISKSSDPYLDNFFKRANLFNLMEMREVLECYAVEKASHVASEENIELLKGTVTRLEKSGNDLEEFLLSDLEFHIAIGKSANLPEMGEFVTGVHRKVNEMFSVIFLASKNQKRTKSIDTAKHIINYIISGEDKQAARCMRDHLSTINEGLKSELLQK